MITTPNLIFILWIFLQMSKLLFWNFRGVKCLKCPLWLPPGTHLCRSSIPTVNRRDLALPIRTQTSEQEYSDLTASNNRRPTALYIRNTPQCFSQGTRLYAFSRWTKHVKISLAYSEDYSKFCRRVKCGL